MLTQSQLGENDRNHWRQWSRFLLRMVASVAAVTFILIGADLKNYIFRKHVYDEIEIGMNGAVADKILVSNEVFCESSQTRQSQECTFDDFWRVYKISFAEPEYVVVRKRLIFKRHTKSFISKILFSLLK
jgi:hypothetical protein